MPHLSSSFLYALVVTGGLLLKGVNASAQATVYGCLNYPQKPISPITAIFTAGGSGDHCMYDTGSSTPVPLKVTKAGLSCVSVGYVKSKSSSSGGDLCATDQSVWFLSYHADSKSESVKTYWDSPVLASESIQLINPPPGAQVCQTRALCYQTEQKWHGDGQLWIIFEPTEATGLSFTDQLPDQVKLNADPKNDEV